LAPSVHALEQKDLRLLPNIQKAQSDLPCVLSSITMSFNTSSPSTSSTPQSLSRPLTPPYFDAIIRTEAVQNTSNLKRKRLKTQYICKHCPSWTSSHRANTISHVLGRHARFESSQLSQTSQSSQPVITSMFRTASDQNIIRNAFNHQGYRDALVGLLTRRRMPFSSIEWTEMKDLALACNPYVQDQLITSQRTAVRLIASNYQLYKSHVIKGSLSTAISPIHISTDLWTSPFRSSLLAVCAQWVDHEHKLQKALLGLPECRYSHSGQQQAHLLLETLEEYEIQSRIGWHTGDNATSNDTCLQHLETLLQSKHKVRLRFQSERIDYVAEVVVLTSKRSTLMLNDAASDALAILSTCLCKLFFLHPLRRPLKLLSSQWLVLQEKTFSHSFRVFSPLNRGETEPSRKLCRRHHRVKARFAEHVVLIARSLLMRTS